MQVDYQKIDDLNARMTVHISKGDYEPKYKTALLDYKKKANLKGFRKGKTPFGYLEKLFGQEVLTRTVTEMLTDGVNDYLEAHEIPYIGQPLPAKDQPMLNLDPKALPEEYVYTFDIGLLPEFEIKGLDEEIDWLDVPVTDAEVDQEWNELLKRQGKYVAEDKVSEESRVNMRFLELENLGPKPDGKEHTRRVYVQMLKDEVKDELMGKQVGDTIRFDPNNFLKQGDLQLFKRYYFDIKDESETLSDAIEGQILDIETIALAEPNEEFFNTAFEPGKVTNEEEAKEIIRGALKQRNDAQSDAHLRHMIEHRLIDSNQFDLPHAFLDRLIGDAAEQKPDADAAEGTTGESEGTGEAKASSTENANGYRWHFIKERLAKQYQIEVTQDEIVRAAADHVYDRFGQYMPYDKMREIITQYLGDKDSVAQLRTSVSDAKLFQILKEQMPVVKKETTKEAFEALQAEHQHHHHAH